MSMPSIRCAIYLSFPFAQQRHSDPGGVDEVKIAPNGMFLSTRTLHLLQAAKGLCSPSEEVLMTGWKKPFALQSELSNMAFIRP